MSETPTTESTVCAGSTGFIGKDADPDVDGLVAGIFGNPDAKVRFCEGCTETGGTYVFETFTVGGCT